MTRSRHRQDKLAFFSLLAGTTSLIPIPFVDDWAYRFVRREMVEAVFRSGPVRITEEQLKELTEVEAPASRSGCLGRTAYLFIWLPIRFAVYFVLRLFKKVLIFLVIKEATDRVALVFLRGVPVRVRCPKQPSPTRLTPVAIATSSVGRGDCQDNGHLSGPGRRQAGL